MLLMLFRPTDHLHLLCRKPMKRHFRELGLASFFERKKSREALSELRAWTNSDLLDERWKVVNAKIVNVLASGENMPEVGKLAGAPQDSGQDYQGWRNIIQLKDYNDEPKSLHFFENLSGRNAQTRVLEPIFSTDAALVAMNAGSAGAKRRGPFFHQGRGRGFWLVLDVIPISQHIIKSNSNKGLIEYFFSPYSEH